MMKVVKIVDETLGVIKTAWRGCILYMHTTVTKVCSNSKLPSAVQWESMDSENLC